MLKSGYALMIMRKKITNLVLNEHPELKQKFLKAKAETMQRKAEREKGGLNDKIVKDKTSERKPKKHRTKR